MQTPLPTRCLSEFLGTFFLVVIGCGAIAVDVRTEALTHVGIAIVWGLIVLTMIYAIGSVSGAHMNPAVTIAFACFKKLPVKDAMGYVPAQCLGALAGAIAIRSVLGLDEGLLGATTVKAGLSPLGGMAVEAMMTAILMFVVIGVSTGAKEESITAGIAVGSTIAMEAFVAGPLTAASMNPARSIGPALASGHLTDLWVYIVGPIMGAIAGGLLRIAIHKK
ncbi:MAG: aquaporin [Rubripirellula sp.]